MVSITMNKDDSERIVVTFIANPKDLGRIKSPLDNLKKGLSEENKK